MSKKRVGTCCICGEEKKLTYEHIPPKSAFNYFNLKVYDFRNYILKNSAKYIPMQQGSGLYSLCEKCNNDTGTWYGSAYAEFASQGMQYYKAGAKGILRVPYTIYPLRVLKQIVSMFASTKGADWCKCNPELKTFLLDPYSRNFPKKIGLKMYMLAKSRVKTEPSSVQMNVCTGERFIGSEIAYTPYSFICVDDCQYSNYRVLNELCSLTSFLNYKYEDRVNLFLKIPRKFCNPITLDFRKGIPDIGTIIEQDKKTRQ